MFQSIQRQNRGNHQNRKVQIEDSITLSPFHQIPVGNKLPTRKCLFRKRCCAQPRAQSQNNSKCSGKNLIWPVNKGNCRYPCRTQSFEHNAQQVQCYNYNLANQHLKRPYSMVWQCTLPTAIFEYICAIFLNCRTSHLPFDMGYFFAAKRGKKKKRNNITKLKIFNVSEIGFLLQKNNS